MKKNYNLHKKIYKKKLTKTIKNLGTNKRIKNSSIIIKKRNTNGNKLQSYYLEEIKKCVIVDIEELKVVVKYNGQNKIIKNFKIYFKYIAMIGKLFLNIFKVKFLIIIYNNF
jgi:hypothetical protein